MSLKTFLSVFSFAFFQFASGQTSADSLKLSLDSAESLFIHGNYLLLAQKYNIEVQKAQEIQARLYPNPNLSLYYSLYNTQTKKFFPAGFGTEGGELSAQLSQLIYLAGQRNKQIRIAQANTRMAEYQFYDLMRTLKYQLRTDFFNIYYLQRSATVYDEEIRSLQQVVAAFEEQEGRGYIAEKEVIRVKGQLYTLLGEYHDLLNEIADQQSELRLILRVKGSYLIPLLDSGRINAFNPSQFPVTTLLDSAYRNRTDLLIARTSVEASRLNYDYQKSLGVPNLTLALAYDQQGSYINNLTSLGAAIDLPFFNRNKGNIQSARIAADANAVLQQNTEATVQENVTHAFEKALANDRIYRTIDPKFLTDFNRLLEQVLINYRKRNLTLLDFLDFYDSYKTNTLSSNAIQFNRLSALEDINYYTGTEFFHS